AGDDVLVGGVHVEVDLGGGRIARRRELHVGAEDAGHGLDDRRDAGAAVAGGGRGTAGVTASSSRADRHADLVLAQRDLLARVVGLAALAVAVAGQQAYGDLAERDAGRVRRADQHAAAHGGAVAVDVAELRVGDAELPVVAAALGEAAAAGARI